MCVYKGFVSEPIRFHNAKCILSILHLVEICSKGFGVNLSN